MMRGAGISAIAAMLRRLRADERGAVLVEFGLALLPMLLLFVLLVEGGRSLWAYQSAIAGVNDAARYVARAELPAGPPCPASAGTVTDDELRKIVEREVRPGFLAPPLTVDAVTAHYDCPGTGYGTARIRVATVTADVTISLPFAGLFALAGGDRRAPLTTQIIHRTRVLGQ